MTHRVCLALGLLAVLIAAGCGDYERGCTILLGHEKGLWRVEFSPDGRILASADDEGEIKLWNVAEGREIASWRHGDRPEGLVFSPDGTMLASVAYDGPIRVWNVPAGTLLVALEVEEKYGNCFSFLGFSPDGKTLVSASQHGVIRFWNTAGWKEMPAWRTSLSRVVAAAFSPDGKVLAVGGYGEIKFFNLADGKETASLRKDEYICVNALAFSPDGKTMAASYGQTPLGKGRTAIVLWDIEAAGIIKVFDEWCGDVSFLLFSPDGGTLMSEDWDSGIGFWDIATGRQKSRIECEGSQALAMALSPDGRKLAVGSNDKVIRVWNVAGRCLPDNRRKDIYD